MIFQREKKQLWRYASSNSAPGAGAPTSRPPQLPPPHPAARRPQSCQRPPTAATPAPAMNSCAGCCGAASNSSSSSTTEPSNTPPPPPPPPPPPYSSLPCGIDSCGDSHAQGSDDESPRKAKVCPRRPLLLSHPAADSSDDCSKGGCCCYGNCGDAMAVDDCEQSNGSSGACSTSTPARALKERRAATDARCSKRPASAPTTEAPQTQTNSFAATAANVFRNCCGAGCWSSEHSAAAAVAAAVAAPDAFHTAMNNNNNNNSNNNCYGQDAAAEPHMPPATHAAAAAAPSAHLYSSSGSGSLKQQHFACLMKKLKSRQLTTLLQAVRSFRDPGSHSASSCSAQHFNCILLKRGLSLGEDPYVIVCRLFLWHDLRSADELRRLPLCTNTRDPVYICCNPLHWCRLLVPETAPPPYQPLPAMDGLRNEGAASSEDSQNAENSVTASMHSSSTSSSTSSSSNFSSSSSNFSSSSFAKSSLRVQIPESFTTNGEGRRACTSSVWCEVAYWELAQRVGERYLAEKPLLSIYSEGPRESSCGMCLKDLVERKSTPSPESVQKARQKIGLGVTLSQESDGVWLYNRSTAPVFLHSPTLSDCCSQVCKVMPGYCVKAFDNQRAREHFLVYPPQVGPVDRYSMRISFAKGWGTKYCRQDITGCPCWLEVLFTRR